jgi:hypothetical protein
VWARTRLNVCDAKLIRDPKRYSANWLFWILLRFCIVTAEGVVQDKLVPRTRLFSDASLS